MPAEFARGFVHGAIKRVAIDGCRGSVEPDFGRIGEFAYDLAEQAGAANARIVDGDAIGFSVAAVDAAAGEIDCTRRRPRDTRVHGPMVSPSQRTVW